MTIKDKQPKNDKFDIRLSEQELRLIAEAAKISHTTLSAFIRQRAVDAAENIILDQTRFVLSEEQWAAIDSAFSESPRILLRLRRKFTQTDPWDNK